MIEERKPDYTWIGIKTVALTLFAGAVFFMTKSIYSQPKPPTQAPDKIIRLRLDIERDRRVYWATQSQYEGTVTPEQRQMIQVIQSQAQKVQLKSKELQGYLNCKSAFDDDTLDCKK